MIIIDDNNRFFGCFYSDLQQFFNVVNIIGISYYYYIGQWFNKLFW